MAITLLNDLFDKVFCINLDSRADRWKLALKMFNDLKIEVERFPAIPGNIMGWKNDRYLPENKGLVFNGECGCIASHLSIYKLSKDNNYNSILIIEDDCDLPDNFTNLINYVSKKLPVDWDILYFGGIYEHLEGLSCLDPRDIHIISCKKILTTHCYAVKSSVFSFLIDTIEQDLPYPTFPMDVFLAEKIQKKCNTYAVYPPIAWQMASYSDIQLSYNYSPKTYTI